MHCSIELNVFFGFSVGDFSGARWTNDIGEVGLTAAALDLLFGLPRRGTNTSNVIFEKQCSKVFVQRVELVVVL